MLAPASWVASANSHPDFSLANLPLGIFSAPGRPPRPGVAVGEDVLDLLAAAERGVLPEILSPTVAACAVGNLNAFFAQGAPLRQALRAWLLQALAEHSPMRAEVEPCLLAAACCHLHLPAQAGDYTDFYVGIEHARAVGALFRPAQPLLPNYKHMPIAYHGRASTVRASGTPVQRPNGQQLPPGGSAPMFGPSQRLDFELELGIWLGPGNTLGSPVSVAQAPAHIAGFCLLNDWSARDIQAWEYQPLGPFLSKSFLTSVSPWVVMPEALAPFRCPQPARPAGDPAPLAYLLHSADQAQGALAITLEVWLSTAAMRQRGVAPVRIAQSNSTEMYWTVAQMLAHHTVNGCQLNPGDLFGSGTLSGASPGSRGSLLELTHNGQQPLVFPGGEVRRFLEDGDEVTLRGRCQREGYASIGFGECRGRVVANPQ